MTSISDYLADYQRLIRGDDIERWHIESQEYYRQYIGPISSGTDDAADAFRHAYVSGRIAQEYNRTVARLAGNQHEFLVNLPNSLIKSIKDGNSDDLYHTLRATNMDLFNNKAGRDIALNSRSPEDFARNLANFLQNNGLILDLDDTRRYKPFDEVVDYLDQKSEAAANAVVNALDGIADWFRDTISGFSQAIRDELRRLLDPIVFDLDGDGIELISRNSSNIYFDMDGDGIRELTGWVGKDDALLAIDENSNGKIDSITELIGDLQRSGFTELLAYDLNNDKVIDAKDAVYKNLKIWIDANSDGVTDAGELRAIADADIRAIDLKFTTVNFTAEGNRIHEQSKFTFTNGTVGTVADAWFDVSNVATQSAQGGTGDSTIDTLPDISGYGDVESLRSAMKADGALTSLVVNVTTRQVDQMDGVTDLVEQILYRWAGTQSVSTTSRGTVFDGRRLATLEKFLGTPFIVNGNKQPTAAAAANLNSAWANLVEGATARLLLGGVLGDALSDSVAYVAAIDRIISVETPAQILARLKAAAPTGSKLDLTEYWMAAIPLVREIVEDASGDPTGAAFQADLIAALADSGLANILPLLSGTIISVGSGAQSQDGLYKGSDTADTILLGGTTQAAYGQEGDDRLTSTSRSTSARTLLDGGAGNDMLQGSDGDDWLDGGAGNDIMAGGLGNDTYAVDSTSDMVTEVENSGTDTVRSSIAYTLGRNLENLTLLGTANLAGTGNELNNILIGNAGANVLRGLDGKDVLDGGAGNDVMYGGLGNDIYVVDSTGDKIVEEGSDYDIVRSSIAYTLGVKLERLELTGDAAINGTGNDLANVLIGNVAANRLDGGAGADRMEGGGGDDLYIVDNVGDGVVEALDQGDDLVQAAVSFKMGANIERLTLTGTLDINAIGNELANEIAGNSGDNQIDGRAGADRMAGGAGDDIYLVDDVGDRVIEAADAGNDTVKVTGIASYTLGATIENLQLYTTSPDSAARSGIGNALANIITGNNGINTLIAGDGNDSVYGLSGNDIIDGGAGNDLIDGGIGNDQMTGGAGNDTFVVDSLLDQVIELAGGGTDIVQSSQTFTLADTLENLVLTGTGTIDGTGNGGANRLTGNDRNNILDGGAGADVMEGGRGNDTYGVDNNGDVVIEAIDAGIDTVRSSITYALGANLENLTLLGTTALNGTGNELDNQIIGTSAANVLRGLAGNDLIDGGAGDDTLYGGLGDDTYLVDSAGDRIVEEGAGIDSVRSSVAFTLASKLENLQLLGTDAINGVGNAFDNRLIGNAGANVLDGKAGADAMEGGAGDDTYYVDNAGDNVREIAAQGTDNVRAFISVQLGANVENLTLIGTGDINGTGNDLANSIAGNAGDNLIDGGRGADQMRGGAGDDSYVVDDIGDVVVEAASGGTDGIITSLATYTLGNEIENLQLYIGSVDAVARTGTGNALANRMTGNDGVNSLTGLGGDDQLFGLGGNDMLDGGIGNDLIDGGAGADQMFGRAGNDIYVVDNVGDVYSELANEGTDTVRASIAVILGANLEDLELTGSAALDGQGNALANRMTGNRGRNNLDGGAGDDIMAGGLGDDTYAIDSAGDIVIETPGAGTDMVRSTISYALGMAVEKLTLLGSATINATGNELNNVIEGNAGKNILIGGFGTDQLIGGGDADIFAWSSLGESGNSQDLADIVQDFNGALGDRLDVKAIDAISGTAANDSFTLIGSGAFTQAGQIRTVQSGDTLFLLFNTDNVLSTTEMMIGIKGTTPMKADWISL